ncbi:MAG: hypothetical protein ABSF75_03905 [Terracidiphilus sp.]
MKAGTVKELMEACEEVARMINGLLGSLEDSRIRAC